MSARLLAWVESRRQETAIDLPPALYTEPHFSPDGARLDLQHHRRGQPRPGRLGRRSRAGHIYSSDLAGHELDTDLVPRWPARVFGAYDGEKNRSTVEVRAADGSGDAAQSASLMALRFLRT